MSMKQKQTHRCSEQTLVAKGEGGTGGKEWEFGASRSNKVLLCSTGNYIQYPVTNHKGKEYEKEYVCVFVCVCVCVSECVALSCFAVQKKLMQHYKSNICQ